MFKIVESVFDQNQIILFNSEPYGEGKISTLSRVLFNVTSFLKRKTSH